MPSKEKTWMCPNHIEHFIDETLLKTSRLSERINLWNKYSILQNNFGKIKEEFINKCKKIKIGMKKIGLMTQILA